MVKFLVVRFSSIGDIVLTTPVVRHLKKQVDDVEVHFLTKQPFVKLLEANPYIDRIHSYEGDMKSTLNTLKKIGFDYIIDLHNNTRSARIKLALKRMDFTVRKLNVKKWILVNLRINKLPDLHMVDRNLETIQLFISERDEIGLDYFIPGNEEVAMKDLPSDFQSGYIGLALGAQHETKKLPLESLIEMCGNLDHPIIILGGPGDTEIGDSIATALPHKKIFNGCGKYSIHQSASLVRQARLLITHDTGLMHIGAAFEKKIIAIWGNTVPEFGMVPFKPHHSSVNFEVKDLKCRPCSKIGFQHCPKKHFKCMKDQDVDGITGVANGLFYSEK
jgi:ADP-heptose:LPS heptosyltransferase